MTTDSNTWIEVIEKSYQFYAYVFTLYVISIGLVRWYGFRLATRRTDL